MILLRKNNTKARKFPNIEVKIIDSEAYEESHWSEAREKCL